MPDVLLEFSRSLAILATVVFAHVLLDRSDRTLRAAAALAACYALVGALGMLTPTRLSPGFIFDLRAAVIGLAMFAVGWRAALAVALALAAFRFHLGGGGWPVGAGSCAIAFLAAGSAGLLTSKWGLGRGSEFARLSAIAVACGASSPAWLLVLLPRSVAPAAFVLQQGVALVFAIMLIGLSLLVDRNRRMLQQAVSRADRMRRRLEQDLQAERALTQTLLAGWPDRVWVKDRAGRFQALNDTMLRALGNRPRAEVLGRTEAELLYASPLGAPDSDVQRLEDGVAVIGRLEREEGRYFSSTRLPIRNGGGDVVGLVGISRDITDQMLAEHDAIQARDAAEQANQAKSVFLAHMSHELRTPLNAVIGFADTLQIDRFAGDAKRVREYAQSIGDAGRHLLFIVNDLLDLSRVDTGRLVLHEAVTPAHRLVERAVDLTRAQAERAGVELRIECDLEALLRVDESRIVQVLVNLLVNAIDATPAGGRIVAACGPTAEGGLAFRVIDTGSGIPEEHIADLLQPFNQRGSALIRAKEGSVGIGLPLSRALVELHGGNLAIESTIGQGTSITVALPPDRLAA